VGTNAVAEPAISGPVAVNPDAVGVPLKAGFVTIERVGVVPPLVPSGAETPMLVTGAVTSAAFGTVPDVRPAPEALICEAVTAPENVGALTMPIVVVPETVLAVRLPVALIAMMPEPVRQGPLVVARRPPVVTWTQFPLDSPDAVTDVAVRAPLTDAAVGP
jgi:hypothetical protein